MRTSRQSFGPPPFFTNLTVCASTTSGLSKKASVGFQGPVSLLGSVTASKVHFTSAAVTGRPSDHFARGSSSKTNSRPSSDVAQRRASAGTGSPVSGSDSSSVSYMRPKIIAV